MSMDVPLDRLDNNVLNIYLEVLLDLMGEHNVHESLVCGTDVFETERYDIVVVVTLVRHEGSFEGIKCIHLYLIVS